MTGIDLRPADEAVSSADAAAVGVPFADARIRVLSPEHLTVCKAVFDRPKDWVDIEAIHATFDGIAWTLDSAQQILPWLGKLLTWMLPLTWLLWAAGVGLMLLLAFAAQLLLHRLGRRALPATA